MQHPASLDPGEAYLSDTPLLRAHRGTQPDLYLCWNPIPSGAVAIDVIVHLHGFSRAGGGMPLSEKVATSGLDLAGRRRPTLAMLPRGNWLRYSWYDFPGLVAGGLDRLVEYGTAWLAARICQPGLQVDRLLLSAHSGGGMPAVDAIAAAARQPDEFFVFDGLYGRDPAGGNPMLGIETVDRWLAARLARESERQGALRVLYIEQQTGAFSRRVAALIDRRLAAFDPGSAAALASRYRVEPALVPHAHIARRCLPELLAAADCDFDWSRALPR